MTAPALRLPRVLSQLLAESGVELPEVWSARAIVAGPAALAVRTASPSIWDVVLEELVPPFISQGGSSGTDLATFFALAQPAAAVARPCAEQVLYDRRVIAISRYETVTVAEFADTGSQFHWDSASRTGVMLITPAGSQAGDVREILHRQLLQPALQALGYVLVHGAGLATAGGGMLVTGDSGAGKTSLQLDLARALSADLIGGGRVYLNDAGSMLPYAGRYMLGTGLVANRPHLGGLADTLPDARGKVTVPATRVAAALGVGLAGHAKLRLILAPRLDPMVSTAAWSRPLATEDAQSVLASQCMSPDTRWPNWLHAFSEVDRAAALAAVAAVAESVPVIPIALPQSSASLSQREARALVGEWLTDG